jgi:hypothetical protein
VNEDTTGEKKIQYVAAPMGQGESIYFELKGEGKKDDTERFQEKMTKLSMAEVSGTAERDAGQGHVPAAV